MLGWVADALTYGVLGINAGTHLGEAVRFFIYDTIKIFLLLIAIIFAVSYLRTYLPKARIRKLLAKRKPGTGNALAALLGTITPFCTCSAIPLFLGFLEAGVPLGITFSFLIASPLVNEVALALLLGAFGWKIALLYLVSGLTIAILAGMLIGATRSEKDLIPLEGTRMRRAPTYKDARARAAQGWRGTRTIIGKVWWAVLIGIGAGAWLHGYVPADALARYAGTDAWYAVPLAVLVGVPLYGNAGGVIPFMSVLTEKGVALGTTLAFMMAVTGLSLPEFLILRRMMKTRLLLLFFGIVAGGIILTGYLFNAVLG